MIKEIKMVKINHRTIMISFLLVAIAGFLLVPFQTAFAASSGTPGQPNQSCQVTTVTPGNAASAPGSAFNPGGTAGMVYAGQQPQNSVNPKAVSQYDVACFQNTTNHP